MTRFKCRFVHFIVPHHTQAVIELAKARREREAIEESDSESNSESTSSLSSENDIGGRNDGGTETSRLVTRPTVPCSRSCVVSVNPRISIARPEVAAEVLFPISGQTTTKIPDQDVGRKLTRFRGVVYGGDGRGKQKTSIGWGVMGRDGGGVVPVPGRSIHKVSSIACDPCL